MQASPPLTSDWQPGMILTPEGVKEGVRRQLADGSGIGLVPSQPPDGKDKPAYYDLYQATTEDSDAWRHRICLGLEKALALANSWAEEARLTYHLAQEIGPEVPQLLKDLRTTLDHLNTILDELDEVDADRICWLPRVGFSMGEYIRIAIAPRFREEIQSAKDIETRLAGPTWPTADQLARLAAAIEHTNSVLASWFERFRDQAMAAGLSIHTAPNIDEKSRLGYSVSLVLVSSRE